ncbi:cytochrome o ubiquinol oxidase subunit III [Buchnera aphidicola (Hyadaphis tataricae)]|uniref:Cytochrome bo(3) ubiquinol oxidase subunit 3 n=1 Tax=Buchnera aphidicola (Hyadaphis tataricae) TaxID=1241859 RepID=A0A4D6Y761_9GAMM|nr:cytochrome c oxidase subunit 3 [Buchnera aphidicola]QCI21750.1 cytochrome o ubiquinol oxidase subunit III [Buchnera aphidicola (Hyadaphis tataricae)]
MIHSSSMHAKKTENNKLFGLWIYLMSDCIMFAVLFAVYTIIFTSQSNHVFIKEAFNLSSVFLETCLLLLSSFSCSLIKIAMNKKNIKMIYIFLAITFLLGFFFLFIEINEFHELILHNYGPYRNSFFSIYFALVGTHGVHIFFGLIFIISIFFQIIKLGITNFIMTRILALTIFWHFLDIIWICVVVLVYLNGAVQCTV